MILGGNGGKHLVADTGAMLHKGTRVDALQLVDEDLILSVSDLPLNRFLLVRRFDLFPRNDYSKVVDVHDALLDKRLGSDQNALSLS